MLLKSARIMKLCCIGKDIDGVQLATSSLFGDDGVVKFTSRLKFLKEFSANMSEELSTLIRLHGKF
jgi:hypothetical protein